MMCRQSIKTTQIVLIANESNHWWRKRQHQNWFLIWLQKRKPPWIHLMENIHWSLDDSLIEGNLWFLNTKAAANFQWKANKIKWKGKIEGMKWFFKASKWVKGKIEFDIHIVLKWNGMNAKSKEEKKKIKQNGWMRRYPDRKAYKRKGRVEMV